MALGFFRRQQKMIVIIMVALMVSFLVGMQGFQLMCGSGGRDTTAGDSRYGEISYGDIVRAQSDLDALGRYLRLAARSIEFDQVGRNNQDASLAYALLLQEARATGGGVTDTEINEYLATLGLPVNSAGYRSLMAQLNRADSRATEGSLRAALGRWLGVLRRYRACQVASPPSDIELRKLFRDLNETLTFRVLEVPAEKFTGSVREPTEQEIAQHFNSYRTTRQGTYGQTQKRQRGSAESFGIGYYQPARAAVAYLLIDHGVISRFARPTDRQVRNYYNANRAKLTKEVPVKPPTTQPATGPAAETQPDAETRTVQMDLDEDWDLLVERLSGPVAEEKTQFFVQYVLDIRDKLDTAGTDAKIYQKVYDSLIKPSSAGELLSIKVPAAKILALRGKPLSKAIVALARAAGLTAICYPWDTEGEFTVSKDILIPDTLRADGPRTVDAVLDEITRLIFAAAPKSDEAIPAQHPKLKWTTCGGFEKVLFPLSESSGMTLLPIRVGQTPLSGADALGENKDIGGARISQRGGQSLAAAALTANPLVHGPVMFIPGSGGTGLNRVLWQVTESRPAHVPQKIEGQLRREVIDGWKLLEAYRTLAAKTAENLAKKAAIIGLEAAAKSADMETSVIGPVPRKARFSAAEMIRRRYLQEAYQLLMSGRIRSEDMQRYMAQMKAQADREAMAYRPVAYAPSAVGTLDLKVPAASQRFLERAFTMVPKDIEKPVTPDPKAPVIAIPMPTARAHFVIQRTAYSPAVISEFEEGGRAQLAREALAVIQWQARNAFFGYNSIVRRLNYSDKVVDRSGE